MASGQLSAKQLREKISSLKEKIESMDSSYETKISVLESKKQALETKSRMTASFKIMPKASEKVERAIAELEVVDEELERLRNERDEKLSEAKQTLSDLKAELKTAKSSEQEEFSKKVKDVKTKASKMNSIRIGMIISGIGLFFALASLFNIGNGNASGVAIFTLILGAISAIFSVPAFLKERKERKKYVKALIGLIMTGVVILSAIIAIIADPIAVNVRCGKFNSEDEMSLSEMSICKARREELKTKQEAEQKAKEEESQKKKDECSTKSYDWNYSENRCNNDDEQKAANEKKQAEEAEKKAKEECSVKNYDWNSTEKRCNNDSEQQAANQKKAEEQRKIEEANKTTTYTGKDHDENDNAGRYNKLIDACLDRLDYHFSGTYPLDSDDGYPIYYSVTLKGDGTLVEGFMNGYHKTKMGNKILDYKCDYKNGSAKIRGLD